MALAATIGLVLPQIITTNWAEDSYVKTLKFDPNRQILELN